MGKNLSELINLKRFEQICEKFAMLMGFSIVLIDNETHEPYFAVSQTNVCEFFHKKFDRSNQKCLISNKRLAESYSESGSINIKMCENGLIHSGTPIIIEGKHVANLFIGQLFFEKPILKFFEHQAIEYSYDKEEYLKAVQKVPIISKETLLLSLSYLTEIASWVEEIGTINTRLKNNELKLKEKNIVLQLQQKTILDNIPNIAWLKDLESNYMFVNQSFVDIVNVPVDQIIGKNDMEVFKSLKIAANHMEQDRNVIRTGKKLKIDETLILKDNEKYYFEIIKMPHIDCDGNIIGTIGIAHDITERK